MVQRLLLLGAVAGGLVGALVMTHRSEGTALAATSAKEEGVIEPQAQAALRRMSDYLAGLKSFRVDTTTVDEKITKTGQKIQELKESRVALRRPHELWIERVGPAGHGVFRYDGKQFSIYSPLRNAYAIAPAPGTLEAAIDHARDRLGIDAPAGDLLVSDSYAALTEGIVTGRYVGLEPIGGAWAHHLAMSGKVVDWQIWIQDGAQPVPLRYVITSKDMPSSPQFTVELRNWEPNAPLSDAIFTFTPPRGAKRVEFVIPGKVKH
jgi:hypothetical protein